MTSLVPQSLRRGLTALATVALLTPVLNVSGSTSAAAASGVGASAGASGPSGAPSTQLTSAAAGSLVLGVGNDYDNSLARTPASGQTLQHQWLDQTTGDTFWVQGVTAPTTAAGQAVRVNDTAPTSDQWNLVAVEVRP